MVCGRAQDADFNANVPPPQELRIQRLDYGRPPLAQNNNNSRPPQIDTHNRANVRLSTPHQKIRVSSIDYTPMGEEKTKFPFYCPLCLYYFSDTIMETSCCKNYICHDCAVHFLKGKEGLPKNLSVVPKKLPPALRCPHCNTEKVSLSYVQKGKKIRSYTTSPSTQARIEALENGFSAKQPETVSPESNKAEKSSDGSDSMPNALDDRTEKEDSGDSGTNNSSGVVTAFNTTQEMEMEAVNLDDSVGLPGVVPNEARLVKSPRQQDRSEATDQVNNTVGEQQTNTNIVAT